MGVEDITILASGGPITYYHWHCRILRVEGREKTPHTCSDLSAQHSAPLPPSFSTWKIQRKLGMGPPGHARSCARSTLPRFCKLVFSSFNILISVSMERIGIGFGLGMTLCVPVRDSRAFQALNPAAGERCEQSCSSRLDPTNCRNASLNKLRYSANLPESPVAHHRESFGSHCFYCTCTVITRIRTVSVPTQMHCTLAYKLA